MNHIRRNSKESVRELRMINHKMNNSVKMDDLKRRMGVMKIAGIGGRYFTKSLMHENGYAEEVSDEGYGKLKGYGVAYSHPRHLNNYYGENIKSFKDMDNALDKHKLIRVMDNEKGRTMNIGNKATQKQLNIIKRNFEEHDKPVRAGITSISKKYYKTFEDFHNAYKNHNGVAQIDIGNNQFKTHTQQLSSKLKTRLGKLRARLAFIGSDPTDPDNAIRKTDYETARKMSDIEYPLVRKIKKYREDKYTPVEIKLDKDSSREGYHENMPGIPPSRVTGTSPKNTSELDFKIRHDTEMDNFKPKGMTDEEFNKYYKPIGSGPFDKKHLHPDPDNIEVDTDEDWGLDEAFENGTDPEIKTTSRYEDKTMSRIFSLMEDGKRDSAKILLMRYMPTGDNNVDDMLDYIHENGIDDLGHANIYSISRKNSLKYSKLKYRLALIEPISLKKKKPRVIKEVSVKSAMIDKIPTKDGTYDYHPDIGEFSEVSIPELIKRHSLNGKTIHAISTTDNRIGGFPAIKNKVINNPDKRNNYVGIWTDEKGNRVIDHTHIYETNNPDEVQGLLKKYNQQSAFSINPNGSTYFTENEGGQKNAMVENTRYLSADALADKAEEYTRNNPNWQKYNGTLDPINNTLLDANNPQHAMRLQDMYGVGNGKIAFNSITDTRKGKQTDHKILRSQLREIEQAGFTPSVGMYEGSLEATKVLSPTTDQEALDDIAEHQRSTGILDANTQFRILDNPKFREN